MATETVHATHATEHHAHHEGAHEHPGEKQYIFVALVLGVLTAVEVLTYFIDFGGAATPLLIVLMVAKFILVILFFMHLKFDNPVFMRLFIAGLILAVGVYLIMLSAFEYFG